MIPPTRISSGTRIRANSVVAWPDHGLEVFLSDDPYVTVAHEPSTQPAFVTSVLDALKPFGIERR